MNPLSSINYTSAKGLSAKFNSRGSKILKHSIDIERYDPLKSIYEDANNNLKACFKSNCDSGSTSKLYRSSLATMVNKEKKLATESTLGLDTTPLFGSVVLSVNKQKDEPKSFASLQKEQSPHLSLENLSPVKTNITLKNQSVMDERITSQLH